MEVKGSNRERYKTSFISTKSTSGEIVRRLQRLKFYPLPFLEYDNVGVGAVLAVFAHENVAFVAGDSEAAAFGTNLLDLVAPVACVVV